MKARILLAVPASTAARALTDRLHGLGHTVWGGPVGRARRRRAGFRPAARSGDGRSRFAGRGRRGRGRDRGARGAGGVSGRRPRRRGAAAGARDASVRLRGEAARRPSTASDHRRRAVPARPGRGGAGGARRGTAALGAAGAQRSRGGGDSGHGGGRRGDRRAREVRAEQSRPPGGVRRRPAGVRRSRSGARSVRPVRGRREDAPAGRPDSAPAGHGRDVHERRARVRSAPGRVRRRPHRRQRPTAPRPAGPGQGRRRRLPGRLAADDIGARAGADDHEPAGPDGTHGERVRRHERRGRRIRRGQSVRDAQRGGAADCRDRSGCHGLRSGAGGERLLPHRGRIAVSAGEPPLGAGGARGDVRRPGGLEAGAGCGPDFLQRQRQAVVESGRHVAGGHRRLPGRDGGQAQGGGAARARREAGRPEAGDGDGVRQHQRRRGGRQRPRAADQRQPERRTDGGHGDHRRRPPTGGPPPTAPSFRTRRRPFRRTACRWRAPSGASRRTASICSYAIPTYRTASTSASAGGPCATRPAS